MLWHRLCISFCLQQFTRFDLFISNRVYRDQDQDQMFKSKTKTFIFVLEAPRDQDPGLEDYITVVWRFRRLLGELRWPYVLYTFRHVRVVLYMLQCSMCKNSLIRSLRPLGHTCEEARESNVDRGNRMLSTGLTVR